LHEATRLDDEPAPLDDDDTSEASFSGLPPPLISGGDYESLVCASCVSRVDTLKRWAGTRGVMMAVRDSPSAPWKVLESSRDFNETDGDDVDVEENSEPASAGTKRSRTPSAVEEPEMKRTRLIPELSTSCIAPSPSVVAKKIYEQRDSVDAKDSLGAGDIFLTEGWRERWCRCNSVSFIVYILIHLMS
jgi:E3 ubiquitin-protein ligase UBR7